MAIDVAADILAITGTGADFSRTAATHTHGSSSDSVNCLFVELQHEVNPDGGLDAVRALAIVGKTEYTNISAWSPGDTFAISGYRTFDVEAVRERIAHLALELTGRIQRGGR